MKRSLKSMICILSFIFVVVPIAATVAPVHSVSAAAGPRVMENLGRGVVAVRSNSNVFISWRLLALDPSGIGFNLYRSTAGGTAVKLNSSVLSAGTNYTDTTADLTKNNAYYVKPVISGVEQGASAAYTLAANTASEPAFVVPIQSGGEIGNVWVGDFDGDHEYDYLVSRNRTATQSLEAYKRDGTLLWSVNLGVNSTNQDNISPGSTAIDVGMWDGVTVYDLDGNGKAEVVIRIANGVTFGDGTVWSTSNSDDKQWLAVLDGMTGKLKKYQALPDDYLSVGPLAMQLGIGYLNGTTPSIVAFMKNRNADKGFNLVLAAYHYTGNNLVMDWKWKREDYGQRADDGHQMRIVDLDSDGKDEIADIGFVLNGDGTLRYSLFDQGVQHGDRFYIGKFSPTSSAFQGYGVQQDNPTGLLEYYYNAATGAMIWQHSTTPPAGDVGRGDVGDIDPRYAGYEVWSFSGVYNGQTNTQITTAVGLPWPAFRIWWDGDLLSESINESKLEKWNYSTNTVSRLLTTYKFHSTVLNYRSTHVFYGDIIGDWREEIIMPSYGNAELVIFTTDIPTSTRLYTLAQNPAYRNSMTIKGYTQSHLTDYYLGEGMTTPPQPNIYLAP